MRGRKKHKKEMRKNNVRVMTLPVIASNAKPIGPSGKRTSIRCQNEFNMAPKLILFNTFLNFFYCGVGKH